VVEITLSRGSLIRFDFKEPTMAEIKKKVIAIIAEQLAKPEDSIQESSHFVDDLGADSLDTVEIIMAIEEAFGLEIPESEQEKIRTVGDAISYIEKHAKA
jgi:acyl carrier protein